MWLKIQFFNAKTIALYSFPEERQEACNVIEIPPRAPRRDSKIKLRSETAEVVSIKRASCFFEDTLDSMPINPHRATDSSSNYPLANYKMEDTQFHPPLPTRPPLCLMPSELLQWASGIGTKLPHEDLKKSLSEDRKRNSTVKCTWVWHPRKGTEWSRSAICFWIMLLFFTDHWISKLKLCENLTSPVQMACSYFQALNSSWTHRCFQTPVVPFKI